MFGKKKSWATPLCLNKTTHEFINYKSRLTCHYATLNPLVSVEQHSVFLTVKPSKSHFFWFLLSEGGRKKTKSAGTVLQNSANGAFLYNDSNMVGNRILRTPPTVTSFTNSFLIRKCILSA